MLTIKSPTITVGDFLYDLDPCIHNVETSEFFFFGLLSLRNPYNQITL